MRICWDNIEGIELSKKGKFRKFVEYGVYIYYSYKESCRNCEKDFFSHYSCKGICCSKNCFDELQRKNGKIEKRKREKREEIRKRKIKINKSFYKK